MLLLHPFLVPSLPPSPTGDLQSVVIVRSQEGALAGNKFGAFVLQIMPTKGTNVASGFTIERSEPVRSQSSDIVSTTGAPAGFFLQGGATYGS